MKFEISIQSLAPCHTSTTLIHSIGKNPGGGGSGGQGAVTQKQRNAGSERAEAKERKKLNSSKIDVTSGYRNRMDLTTRVQIVSAFEIG